MQALARQVQWISIDDIDEQNACEEGEVVVNRSADGRYELLSGGRKLRGMRQNGQLCVDAVLDATLKLEEKMDLLLDGLVRGGIHYLDEAGAYRELLEKNGCTLQQLSERIGRTPATIRRKLRLLELGEEPTRILRENGLCEGYAQELLRVPGVQGRLRVLGYVTEGGLSVKETEKLVDGLLSRMPVPMTGGRRMKPVMRDSRLYLNAIRGIVEQMQDAGLEAQMQVHAGRYVTDVRITVPSFAPRNR